MERYGLATLEELAAFVREYRFHGKSRCQLALAIAQPGSASVKETELRVRLELRGIRGFSINCTVFGSAYDTGVEHTLDLALEKYRVGLDIKGISIVRTIGSIGGIATSMVRWRRWDGRCSK
ncbi:hypothetical protein [Bifidobacterium criceti]|uniref:Uncharacterized protein n=1 Tax=Bifidobacterium criceti TaxID=1960969 RepID=A0A2A2EJA3_9BIFI|nr:hypothetical protein [Bifidobacterium criceti]PAU68986.1 hypothetical protein B1526_0179 [Bifidobacterium criceti]